LQKSVVHSLLSSQSFGGPGAQKPAWHVSLSVQGFSSLHGVPFATGWQRPVDGTHV
jgi:hypothetical protein